MFGCVSSGLTNIIFGLLPAIQSGQVFLGMSLLVRSLTAVGESAMSSAVYPLAMRCDRSSKSTVLAVMETMFGAGTTIGPFLGGLLFNCGGFLLPFLICGGLLILSGLAAFLVLRQADHDDQADLSAENDAGGALNDEETEAVSSLSYTSLLRSPLMVVAASLTFLTGVSTQWYQPSLEPYVRNQFGLSSFQVSQNPSLEWKIPFSFILFFGHPLTALLCQTHWNNYFSSLIKCKNTPIRLDYHIRYIISDVIFQ